MLHRTAKNHTKVSQSYCKLRGSCDELKTRKENEVALQRAQMVRWMCNVKTKDRVPSKELKERIGIDDIILIL